MSMSKGRSASVMVNIEPAIHRILLDFVHKEGLSASGFARKLIIRELKDKHGLIPDKLLAELLIEAD